MAKRKLTAEQREELRKMIARDTALGRSAGEIVKELSEKYGITTVSARWYLKSGEPKAKRKGKAKRGRPKGSGRKPGKRGRPKGSRAAKRRGRAKGRVAAILRNGQAAGTKVLSALESAASKAVEKAKEARKLLPRWQALVKKEGFLRRAQAKASRALAAVRKRAKKLGARLKELAGK